MKIYTAGPMRRVSMEYAKWWRAEVERRCPKHTFIHPTDKVEDTGSKDGRRAIVAADLRAIQQADAILAYCHMESTGTPMELVYGHIWNKINIVVCPDPSSWHEYHSDKLLPTLEAAIEYLNR
jgi:nucleoside 2-deoxyribosyltransferase